MTTPVPNTERSAMQRRIEERKHRLFADDGQFRAAAPSPAITSAIATGDKPAAVILDEVLDGYADRPALGRRVGELVTDDATGRARRRLTTEFETITYGELANRVRAISAAWRADDVGAGNLIATLGFTSTDYATLDLACTRVGAVAVPLQTSSTAGALRPIIEETEPTVLAVSVGSLDVALDLLDDLHVAHLVIFDVYSDDDDHRDALRAARDRVGDFARVETIDDLIERGHALPTPGPAGADGTADFDAPAALIYTSGSTGTPKGAIHTLRHVTRNWTHFWFDTGDLPDITVNYMPMSHVAGRVFLTKSLATGGTSYFVAAADLSTLLDDFGLVRPTDLLLVPRVCDMLFQHFTAEVDRRTEATADTGVPTSSVEADVMHEIRDGLLGGRVLAALCGTAPLAPEMARFIVGCLDVPLVDGYGSTEAGAVLIDNVVARPPVTEYKLIDVPELGYYADDHPHPRGELAIKSRSMFPGYYKRPETTAEVFDEDGYYLTGDIMAELGTDHLQYVDRRKNVLKLSQGEFVAVSRLEAIFASAESVGQIFVYGNSARSFLLAVVVPTDDALHGADGDLNGLRVRILRSLQATARDADLNGYEVPRDVIVETTPFSRDNGLLSGVGKVLRPKLIDHYRDRLEQMYADLASGQTDQLRDLRRNSGSRSVVDTVTRAALAVVGGAVGDTVEPDARFGDLGGDSLSALTFSNLLTEIFDVDIPVGVVMGAATDLQAIADEIDRLRTGDGDRPTFASVHGEANTTISATDLTLAAFLDTDTLDRASSLPRASEVPETVVLTGANGYLGRFLCLEWLERLERTAGHLVCVVRGRDDADAFTRLRSAFDSGDATLLSRFDDLADRRLTVLAGDVASPYLGLDRTVWQRLADTADLIVHPAALVNHVLPYEQLFGPNVVGTAEVVRLAVTSRLKPVTYLSTVGVAADGGPSILAEDLDIRTASPTRSLTDGYASGYGNSKWAGEILLREAHDLCELPVAVFRSDMILAHREFAGQLNAPDVFSRLLISVIATGLAPRTFYERPNDAERPRAHYDGLPADFTAAAITDLGSLVTKGYETFNVVNPHTDGISLDTVVDWLIDAGVQVSRIDDYAEWRTRFETALTSLPERRRAASVLPLLHAFAQPTTPIDGSEIPARHFRSAVSQCRVDGDGEIPHLTSDLIAKYVSDLGLLGLVDR